MGINTKICNIFDRVLCALETNSQPDFDIEVRAMKKLGINYESFRTSGFGGLKIPKKINQDRRRRRAVRFLVERLESLDMLRRYGDYQDIMAARAQFLGIKQEKVTPTERGQAPEEPVREEVYDLHIGDKKTFNGWKLIWTVKGEVRLAVISEKTAKMLIADGMTVEG